MTNRRLNEKQIAAIEYLAIPNRGGLTYKQIAEEIGVDESTLHRWRNDDTFYNAVSRAVVRGTQDRLADMFEAAIDGVIVDKNAALFRTIIQTHGLLTEKVEVNSGGTSVDTDAMKAQIEAFRKGSDSHDE